MYRHFGTDLGLCKDDLLIKIEVIPFVRQMVELYGARKTDLHMIFIDIKKAYDKLDRNVLWWEIVNDIDLVNDMYHI